MKKIFFYFIILFIAFFDPLVAKNAANSIINTNPIPHADNITKESTNMQPKNKLQEQQQWIQQIKKEIQKKEKEEEKETTALRLIEIRIGFLQNSLKQMENSLIEKNLELQHLETQKQELNKMLEQKRAQFKQQIKASYIFKNQSKLKIFLSQKNTYSVDRLFYYYRVLEQYHYQLLSELLRTLKQIALQQEEIDQKKIQIAKFHEQEKQILQEVLTEKNNRKKYLTQLKNEINNNKLTLITAEQQEKILLSQLSNVQRIVGQKRLSFFKPSSFTNAQGNLLWPVTKQKYSIKNLPILIKSEEGETVYAIHDGQIVFADWLKGFGLLIIIDHGEGYLSLYGHNQILYKNLGESVKRGEIIAKVGNSGGQDDSGLYFDIRKNGKSVNLANWFK